MPPAPEQIIRPARPVISDAIDPDLEIKFTVPSTTMSAFRSGSRFRWYSARVELRPLRMVELADVVERTGLARRVARFRPIGVIKD